MIQKGELEGDGTTTEAAEDNSDVEEEKSVQELADILAAIPAPPWPPTEFYSLPVLAAQRRSLGSLQRSLVMCHEMDAFARHTMTKLDEGANKLQMIEDQQMEMEKDLLETADNFEDMDLQCCGLICPWWRTKPRGPIEDAPDGKIC